VTLAEFAGDGEQFVGAAFSLPVALEGALELAASADAGKARISYVWHG
jgi:hypothetical protein